MASTRCAGASLVFLLSVPGPALADATLSIESATVTEGNGGQVDAVFTVTSTPDSSPTTVDYTTEDGTAVAGSDYVATSDSLTIPANETQASIVVKVNGDTQVESDEGFSIRLSNANNEAVLVPDTAKGNILNDDQAAPPGEVPPGEVQEGTKGKDNQKGTAGVDIQLGGGGRDTQKGAAGDDIQVPDGPFVAVCIQLRAARADANAKIDAFKAAVARTTSPGALNFLFLQVEAARDRSNAQFDALLAALQCRSAKAASLVSTSQAKPRSLDDTLKGGSGDDLQLGGGGNDRIEGGPGRDIAFAGGGADRIDVKGGGADIVDCGPGRDVVRSDSNDFLRKNCE